MTQIREFQLHLPTGVVLSGAERGDPTGTPLVLVHGYSDSWRSYGPFMAELPASVRAIALTMRGHGDSSKPEIGYGSADFAADIAAAMDRLGIAKAYIAGHSMGSLIGAAFALEHADRLLGLVLIGAFATLKGHPGVRDMWDNVIAPMGEAADPQFVREFQESTIHRPVPKAFLEMVIAESLKVPGHVWRGALGALMAEDRTASLSGIAAPALILAGDRDIFSDAAELQRLATAMPRAGVILHEQTGHNPHWESPARAAREILRFMSAEARAVA
jgi:non-heme chloroperoxidase